MEKVAVIAYGDGGELGNFKVFADSLAKELKEKYKTVIVKHTNRDIKLFNLIESIDSSKKEIAELHIFSHSIGAGLFLGYRDPVIAAQRNLLVNRAARRGRNISYQQAVNTETGAIQTDDLKSGIFTAKKDNYRKKFSSTAFIKIWGCNSGVKGWVYSDGGIVDQNNTSAPYYWRAFNEKNVPKPSIAQALAKYFNIKVYGAKSGASIEVKYKKKWISSKKYKNKVGHWPSGRLPHRLVPDKGTYYEFKP